MIGLFQFQLGYFACHCTVKSKDDAKETYIDIFSLAKILHFPFYIFWVTLVN